MMAPSLPVSGNVGGIIFYIDSTADGTYTFYNDLGAQVSAPSVGTDCTGWTYVATGATKDKYYVVYDQMYTADCWGPSSTLAGASGTAIGTGRSNTESIIGSASDVSGSIWEKIRTMRANEAGGCVDWFAPSKDELLALVNSEIMELSGRIWSSSEYSENSAYEWWVMAQNWDIDQKQTGYRQVCGVRAF